MRGPSGNVAWLLTSVRKSWWFNVSLLWSREGVENLGVDFCYWLSKHDTGHWQGGYQQHNCTHYWCTEQARQNIHCFAIVFCRLFSILPEPSGNSSIDCQQRRRNTSCSRLSRHGRTVEPTLYYTILYYTILYCTILYYTILHYTILYYSGRTHPPTHYGPTNRFWNLLSRLFFFLCFFRFLFLNGHLK